MERIRISAFAAGVLSILLIFMLFSSVSTFGSGFDNPAGVIVTQSGESCSMNSSASAIPFANTRFMPSAGADMSEENKLLNIPCLSVADYGDVIDVSGTAQFSEVSDRHVGFLVRLLI